MAILAAMAKPSREEVRRRIHEAGLRATAPRVAVLELLDSSHRPLSHTEVVEGLARGHWDQATIYRNLVKLADSNLAHVASRVYGIARYEVRRSSDEQHLHPHFACRECGGVKCLPGAELSTLDRSGWQDALAEAELQAVGRCPECRRKQSPRKPKGKARATAARKAGASKPRAPGQSRR